MKKGGIATLLLASFVLTACSGTQVGSNSSQQSNVQDSTVTKDYREELKKLSDASYKDARGKTDAITTYAENYANAIGSPVDNQDKKLNELLATVLDKSYTNGSSTNMATNMFEAYFLQASKTTDFKASSDELALAETYYETVRSAIRLADAKKLGDTKTAKSEKVELKTLKKALAAEAKKLGTVTGDKVYAQLTPKKPAASTTQEKTTTAKTTTTKSDTSLAAKKEASQSAEKVTLKQQTPVTNPSSAANQPYHYVTGYVYVSTGRSDKGLFLRSGPGQGYSKRLNDSLKNGTGLYLVGRQGDWYNVYIEGTNIDGWVHGSYVSSYYSAPAPDPTPVESLPSYVSVHTNGDTLRLRSGAGKGYSEIAALQNGDVLEVLDQSGNWYKVYAASVGKTGWVSKDFAY